MDEAVETQAILLFVGALVAAAPVGALVGWRTRLEVGIAVGCLLIGAGGLVAAGLVGWDRYRFLSGTVVAEGVRIGTETQHARDDDGRGTPAVVPVVRFRAADGEVHEVRGLGGSQAAAQPGDSVLVRYPPGEPSRAVIADFQNVWGAVWGLALFGVLPLLFGLFFAVLARDDARVAARRRADGFPLRAPPDPAAAAWGDRRPQRERWARQAQRVGAVVVVLSILSAMLPLSNTLAILGVAFSGIGLGVLILLGAFVLRGHADAPTTLILMILGAGFAAFGAGALLLAA